LGGNDAVAAFSRMIAVNASFALSRFVAVCATGLALTSPLPAQAQAKSAASGSATVGSGAAGASAAPAAPISVPAAGTIEVGFSPDQGAETLVLRVIDSAKTELNVMAYSFSSKSVTEALVRAAKRGVTVSLLADHKRNLVTDRSGKSRHALETLAEAGVNVRIVSAFKLHHDKVLIADRQTVELGSFNFAHSAAHENSENALVNWNNPALAKAYLAHFERNWALSQPFRSGD
jgi:phosphatidylserine/phosphatidylglycerophosphate/cardiolipin synthase-like enzyme